MLKLVQILTEINQLFFLAGLPFRASISVYFRTLPPSLQIFVRFCQVFFNCVFRHSFQVQHGVSAPLDEVTASVARNGICLKGVIAVPEVGYSGELQNLNQNFRTELDLYANVVKVST